MAGVLLDHLRGRPLTLLDGDGAELRWGEDALLETVVFADAGGRPRHGVLLENARELAWAAGHGAIEVRVPPVRRDDWHRPAMLVLDLDPAPPATGADACRVALDVRDVAAAAGLLAWVRASGGGGLRVTVPLAPGHSFGEARATARWIADGLAAQAPDRVSGARTRSGRVSVRWCGNDPAHAAIAPYSLCAPAGAEAAAPLRWAQVQVAARPGAAAPGLDPGSVLERLDRDGDPSAGLLAAPGCRLPVPP